MIREHRKLNVQDLSNRGNDMSVEINWNRNPQVRDCKYVRIKIGNGPEGVVKRDHLFELLMLLADEKQRIFFALVTWRPVPGLILISPVLWSVDVPS